MKTVIKTFIGFLLGVTFCLTVAATDYSGAAQLTCLFINGQEMTADADEGFVVPKLKSNGRIRASGADIEATDPNYGLVEAATNGATFCLQPVLTGPTSAVPAFVLNSASPAKTPEERAQERAQRQQEIDTSFASWRAAKEGMPPQSVPALVARVEKVEAALAALGIK